MQAAGRECAIVAGRPIGNASDGAVIVRLGVGGGQDVRADAENGAEEAPFPIEQSSTVEENNRHPMRFTLTAIHRHPLPRH